MKLQQSEASESFWNQEWEDEPNDQNYILTEVVSENEEHVKCATFHQLVNFLTRESKQGIGIGFFFSRKFNRFIF